MEKCWHSDPTKRPTATKILRSTLSWYSGHTLEIRDQIEKAEIIRIRNLTREIKTQHSGVIYTSRLIPNIPKVSGLQSTFILKYIYNLYNSG